MREVSIRLRVAWDAVKATRTLRGRKPTLNLWPTIQFWLALLIIFSVPALRVVSCRALGLGEGLSFPRRLPCFGGYRARFSVLVDILDGNLGTFHCKHHKGADRIA
jgi:hypothetical protein